MATRSNSNPTSTPPTGLTGSGCLIRMLWFLVARPAEVFLSLGIITLLYVASLQFIALGIMGQYIGGIVKEVRRRPTYVVAEALGFDEPIVKLPTRDGRVRAMRTAS